MKRQHRKERAYAWLVFLACLIVILATMGVAGFFAYKNIQAAREKRQADRIAAELAIKEEQERKAAELLAEQEAEEESESFDQESLDAIFDDTDVDEEPVAEVDTQDEELASRASEIINGMSIEQKVAQLFFIRQEAITGVDVCTAAGDKTKEALEKYPVGGIIYFADNIEDPEQLTEMTSNLQGYSKEIANLPIFIGIDEEGGAVARIANNENFEVTKFDSMKAIGDSGNVYAAYEAGKAIGSYLKDYGFNVDFAPDADVLTNPDNAIGDRSFGEDPQLVSDMSAEFASGIKDAGVMPCMKHYPGHGAVAADTHESNAVIDKSWDELKGSELMPFIQACNDKVPCIMVSHIAVAEIDGETPASLSTALINDKLRSDLGYKGIVITDSLSMKAVTDNYSSKEAAIKAINAGADMLLMPSNFEEAYEGLLAAVEEGSITEDRINESLVRIIKEKLKING